MTAKSIIQVDIKDDAFKAFLQLFEKYQQQLSKMPEMWDKIGESMSDSSTRFDAAVSAIVEAANAMGRLKEEEDKAGKDQEKYAKNTELASQSFDKIQRTNKMIREDISFTTANLGKWLAIGTAFGTGMALAQKVWGAVGNTAQGAVNVAMTAGKVGVSPGQLQAAQAAYDPYLDTQALLSKIAEVQLDRNKWKTWSALGITDYQNKTAADMLPEVVSAIQSKTRQVMAPGGGGLQQLEGLGVTNLVDQNTAREIAGLSNEQVKDANKIYENEKNILDLSKQDLGIWTKINQQLSIAGAGFSNALKQAGAGDWSAAYNSLKVVQSALHNADQPSGQFIDDAIIDMFTGLSGSGKRSGPRPGSTAWLNLHGGVTNQVSGKIKSTGGGGGMGSFIAQTAQSLGVPPLLADFIWMMESGRGKHPGLSSAGALGDFQLMAGTASDMGVTDRKDPKQSAMGGIKYLAKLLSEFHNDIEEVAVAYNAGDKTVKAALAKYGSDWRSHLKPEAQNYDRELLTFLRNQQASNRHTSVHIQNDTGGDVNVKASQLPMGYGAG